MSDLDQMRDDYTYIGQPDDDPQDFDIDALAEKAAKGALNDAEMVGLNWETLPTDPARFSLDVMIGDLLVLGHRETTVGYLAKRFGILDDEGNWT